MSRLRSVTLRRRSLLVAPGPNGSPAVSYLVPILLHWGDGPVAEMPRFGQIRQQRGRDNADELMGWAPESQVRTGLATGGDWVQTFASAKSCRRAGGSGPSGSGTVSDLSKRLGTATRKNCALPRGWVRARSSMRLRRYRGSAFSDRDYGAFSARWPSENIGRARMAIRAISIMTC
jgi:hypothetical protein